jgi:hypothetical protein
MGIYDRDYYREKDKEGNRSKTIFKAVWYLILLLFALAFAVYIMAIFSH